MLKRFGQAYRIGLGLKGLALVKTSRLVKAAPLMLAEQPCDLHEPDALAKGLRGLFAEAPPAGMPVSVVLADELARLWQVAPPPGATRPADLEAACALRFQHLFGAQASEWRISADWDAAHPFLAAAVPAGLLAQLEQGAREHRFHLVEVAPQFVAAMNEWRRERRPGAWFGLAHAGVLTLAAFDSRSLAAVRTAPIPEGADREWLEAHVAREALRVGVGRPERLQLAGAAPKDWGSSVGRLKFACTLFETDEDKAWSDLARLARTGSSA
jgi:hypothetical protein